MGLGFSKNETNSSDVKLAVMEQKMLDFTQYLNKLDDAISKMSEVSSNLTKMLTVHEEKINFFEKTDDILFKKIKELEENNTKEHHEVIDKIQTLSNKVQDLNRFRWIAVGVVSITIIGLNFITPMVSVIFEGMVAESVIQRSSK